MKLALPRITGPLVIGAGLMLVVLAAFATLDDSAGRERQPSSTPTPVPTASVTPSPTPSRDPVTPAPTPEPTDTPEPTAEPTVAPTMVPTPVPAPPPPPPPPGRPNWSQDLLRQPLSRGDASKPVVHLTFDDGWGYPDEILSILLAKGVRATACFNGAFIDTHPAVAVRWDQSGMSFCNHTYNHGALTQMPPFRMEEPTLEQDLEIVDLLYADEDDRAPFTSLSASMLLATVSHELSSTAAALHSIVPGAEMQPFFRPPYGDQNATVRDVAAQQGYRTIIWSLDPQDWRDGVDPSWLAGYVTANATNGDIILLHFGRSSTVTALPAIIDGLHARGFAIDGLDSLPDWQ